MNSKYYESYLEYHRLGLKDDAQKAVVQFVDSMKSQSEKRTWTFSNLPELLSNGETRIRHEIYEGIVFPVLLKGYRQGRHSCKYWLGMTSQNLAASKKLHEQVDFKSPLDLFKDAYHADHSCIEYRQALLKHLLSEFDYLDQEWPSGILVRSNYPSVEWDRLRNDIDLATCLDENQNHAGRLVEFSDRVEEEIRKITLSQKED